MKKNDKVYGLEAYSVFFGTSTEVKKLENYC
jgi:hypothetical protein